MSLIPNLCMEIENSSFAGFNPVTIPGGALRDESFRGAPAARGLNRRPGEHGDAPLRLLRSFGIYICILAPLLRSSFLRSSLLCGLLSCGLLPRASRRSSS